VPEVLGSQEDLSELCLILLEPSLKDPPGHGPVQPAVGDPASAGGWTG